MHFDVTDFIELDDLETNSPKDVFRKAVLPAPTFPNKRIFIDKEVNAFWNKSLYSVPF